MTYSLKIRGWSNTIFNIFIFLYKVHVAFFFWMIMFKNADDVSFIQKFDITDKITNCDYV